MSKLKIFAYEVKLENGTASGSLEASSKKEAEAKLRDMYERDHMGKKSKNSPKLGKIQLEEVEM